MSETIIEYLSYPFVRNALVAGVLISLCAALLGVPLVLRRLSFIGDGLSHVAFGAMAVAGVMNFADTMALSLPVTIAAALVLMRSGRGSKTGGDAMLAMLSVGAMAAGYLMMNLKPSSSNVSGDVCTTLFGSVSILTLTTSDMWISVGLSLAVCALWLFSYHHVFDMTFDEAYAQASGSSVTLFNTLTAVVVAVVIVISMRLVGTLLVSALLVVPAIAAMKVAKSFRAVCIVAAVFTVVCSLAGITHIRRRGDTRRLDHCRVSFHVGNWEDHQMKKGAKACLAGMFIVVGMLLCIDSTSKEDGIATDDAGAANAVATVDFDFTRMNQTMRTMYAYRLAANPKEFEGKTFRLSGVLLTRVDEPDGKRRFARLLGSPGGCSCCSPGGVLEFEPKGSYKWPTNFPPVESGITVSGLLKMVDMEEDGQTYAIPRLFDADILPL